MRKHLFLYLFIFPLIFSCKSQAQNDNIINSDFAFADKQLTYAISEIEKAIANEPVNEKERREKRKQGPLVSPRSIDENGNLIMVTSRDWTSGFFPGELWYMYEYTQDEKWKTLAQEFTVPIEQEKTNGITHDMGFKVYCSFGNGYRLTKDEQYKDVLLQSAYTLITRYKPNAKIIRSWDHNKDKWQSPVIIDNMMNLELLFWAFKESKDSLFYNIAVNHATTTMKNHFRDDYSSYHVVDYDTITGNVLAKHTHQGYSHQSAWARGQAWAVYGYTMCYRETGKSEFLEQAKHVANYIFTHPNLPQDLIPYWDYDAPEIPNEPRDVSAATVTASALYELSLYDKENSGKYLNWANTIIDNLSNNYLAKEGNDRGFLLLHSTGSKPGKFEVDKPLSYADYYFLEALLRKQKLEQSKPLF
ncbi:glycoside hydrolase family 88 protein [Dysgonomonas sp. BGC7]|uniref:glycoside hydrolase family 88 protein n=1 Tax=Dysgonomonas sp. BGC7 TaxID=1658008 RepID=UPI0009E61673|nr:glycoside hydrolase family 88 protein [Dysgonomonas sp. BGC7]MBD8388752.1 glycoside hydrolase family 88 protein [Dysgonomonas sp. BGC7]